MLTPLHQAPTPHRKWRPDRRDRRPSAPPVAGASAGVFASQPRAVIPITTSLIISQYFVIVNFVKYSQ
jgi:hypothetical protein